MARGENEERRISQIARILSATYSDWDHFNLRNPLNELLFILCSTRTGEDGYRSTYATLRRHFPTFEVLARATQGEIAEALAGGGLQNNKARAIRGIFDAVIARFGRLTLSPLSGWTDAECEEFLTGLPGVGKKVARCVMMYSLDRGVFPVDTHCWRISRRLGLVRPTQKDGHCAGRDMDRLQAKIPSPLRHSLHVNMISLGREICVPGRPRCEVCPIGKSCRKVGLRI
jgi:endonuclease-3